MTTPPPPAWLSPAQIAAKLGVSSRQVRRWIADGRLPATRFGPRTVRVHRDDLGNFGEDA